MDPTLRIFDVTEKDTGSDGRAPAPPSIGSKTGFPEHKKRTHVSAFKQRRQGVEPSASKPDGRFKEPEAQKPALEPQRREAAVMEQKKQIDRENQSRLASMSPAEIEEAQRELFNGLDPSIVQMLLRRATLDDAESPSPFDYTGKVPEIKVEDTVDKPSSAPAQVPEKDIQRVSASIPSVPESPSFDEDFAPPHPPADLLLFSPGSPASLPPAKGPGDMATATSTPSEPTNSTHFHGPGPANAPSLSPSDPDFLSRLHDKYFPTLSADPARLAWMAPLPSADSPADRDSPYHPSRASLAPGELRFDFRGALLPPRVARVIPVSRGLHHHGEAPEAAGYTVPELARLARSAVPAQRCVAFMVLGRLLYRLGKGEWGGLEGRGGPQERMAAAAEAGGGEEEDGGEGAGDEIALGIWQCVQDGRVLETLADAADAQGGHNSSKVYATEALWLFEKGGWRERWKGR